MNEITILEKSRVKEFYDLVRDVYNEFVSKDYSDIGNKTFFEYVNTIEIEKRMNEGNWFYVCIKDSKIVGVLEVRNKNHIALFFVDNKYQKQNIGRDLFNYYLKDLQSKKVNIDYIEVNSSIYAKEIYMKLGFKLESDLQETNGIKYYYMKRVC
jgi:ribosomal protein S18 acetylase RimI-like enzyme